MRGFGILVVLGLLGAAAVAGGSFAAAPPASGVASCEQAIIGHGPADWRGESVVAGPVGVRKPPLARMSRTKNGLHKKMMVLVEGREPETVTIAVPAELRGRVFLYYGDANSFRRHRGLSEVRFDLCGNKPRTIWPGGIRVKGTAPVRLSVTAADGAIHTLRLGRPRVFVPDAR